MGTQEGEGEIVRPKIDGQPLGSLSFQYPFRKYQKMMLDRIDPHQEERKFHICAPPGSGKTIVGLEIIRLFGHPAVVFAPTTTIQVQWREKVGMFTQDPDLVTRVTSMDPRDLAAINVFTYQLISTQDEAKERGLEMAALDWREDLVNEGRVSDEAAAQQRLEELKENNPRDYRKELLRRYNRLKRDLLRRDDIDIAAFLHPNARRLIDQLVAAGVRTVVLDECHHLLDYWAIVLRYLLKRIDRPIVVGLTATLPSPGSDEAFENYDSLLGDVDFEVPTPAVVKEGDLAPYRDLVYFVNPSRRESRHLHNIQKTFEEAISDVTGTPRFREWVAGLVLEPRDDAGDPMTFEKYVNDHPLLSVAALRFLRAVDHPAPEDLEVPAEAEMDMDLEDWAILLERYSLDVLRVSQDKEDHKVFRQLKRAIRPFGLSITERGLRHGRSAGDLVMALSESKDEAVVRILSEEARAMGDRLRAIVVTDFERMTTITDDLEGVLDRDAGSAMRVFHRIVRDREAGRLDPLLVTGKRVLVDEDQGEELLEIFNRYLERGAFRARCRYVENPLPGVVELEGEGPDWSTRVYVAMITEAFEQGHARCLVGTRGIFGEGWDALSLNTLIDLTSVTTSTSVQQLRGRTIRKDPSWPRKVAHNWDVICVATDFKQGDSDLRRLERRHSRYWGVVSITKGLQLGQELAAAQLGMRALEWRGRVMKGLNHVDPNLAFEVEVKDFRKIKYKAYTEAMMAQIWKREGSYDLWDVGGTYSNFTFKATRLVARDLKFRTVYTLRDTIKRLLREFRTGIIVSVLYLGIYALEFLMALPPMPVVMAVLALVPIGVLVANFRRAMQVARRLLLEQPPDLIIRDVALTVLSSLRFEGLVSIKLRDDYVRITQLPDDSIEVFLDYASPEDSDLYISSFLEVFEPVGKQRYLILRDDTSLPGWVHPFWVVLRGWVRRNVGHVPAYHPVPKLLGAKKNRAHRYAKYWKRYVGGGELVFTRSEAGRAILFRARAQQKERYGSMAFEEWR